MQRNHLEERNHVEERKWLACLKHTQNNANLYEKAQEWATFLYVTPTQEKEQHSSK